MTREEKVQHLRNALEEELKLHLAVRADRDDHIVRIRAQLAILDHAATLGNDPTTSQSESLQATQ